MKTYEAIHKETRQTVRATSLKALANTFADAMNLEIYVVHEEVKELIVPSVYSSSDGTWKDEIN